MQFTRGEERSAAVPRRSLRREPALRAGWTFSFNPDYRIMVGSNYELHVGANIRFSDGYWITDNEDPRNEVAASSAWTCASAGAAGGRWEAAIYGRDLTDERLTVGGQPNFHTRRRTRRCTTRSATRASAAGATDTVQLQLR